MQWGIILTTWFGKVVAVGSPPICNGFTAWSSSLSFQSRAWFSSCWVDLESNQKAVGYCQDICANTMPSGLLWPMLVVIVVHRHHSWVGLLVTLFLWKYAQNLLVSWKLVLREETFSWYHFLFGSSIKMAEHTTTPPICINVIYQKDVGTAVFKRMGR